MNSAHPRPIRRHERNRTLSLGMVHQPPVGFTSHRAALNGTPGGSRTH